ncbi:hypothetical protein Dimus_039732 [Dionaea muscipula]
METEILKSSIFCYILYLPPRFQPPKTDFPSFNGEEALTWVKKCEKYFSLYHILEDGKVKMGALHMKGKAEKRYFIMVDEDYQLDRWPEFVQSVVERFGEEVRYGRVEEFNKLRPWNKIGQVYQDFEEKRYDLLQAYPH